MFSLIKKTITFNGENGKSYLVVKRKIPLTDRWPILTVLGKITWMLTKIGRWIKWRWT